MASDLLPPAATPLERALSLAGARVGDVPVDLGQLWDTATCPAHLLPWLAWALSIDRWSPEWTEAQKRANVASAIADQRIKGSRLSVERVLADFDALLTLVEWFEASPQADPYTFAVHLDLQDGAGLVPAAQRSADFARRIVLEVAQTKPLRAHFELQQRLRVAGVPAPIAAAQATGFRRFEGAVGDADPATPWADLLQDHNGEPLEDDTGMMIDGSAT